MIAMADSETAEFLTVHQAAEVASEITKKDVPDHIIWYWLNRRYLRRHKLGRATYILRGDLEAYLRRQPKPVEE